MDKLGFKALIIGGTGATGREIVKALMASDKWTRVTVIVRRKIDDWKKFDQAKFEIVEVPNLDVLAKTDDWDRFLGYDSLFLSLGGRSNAPKEELYKIEYTYAYNAALIAKKCNIPHVSYVNGEGASKTSWIYHARVKAMVEEDMIKLGFKRFTSIRPGFLLDRDNDHRPLDFLYKYIPFVPKIKTEDLGKAIVIEAEQVNSKGVDGDNIFAIYNNAALKEFVFPKPNKKK